MARTGEAGGSCRKIFSRQTEIFIPAAVFAGALVLAGCVPVPEEQRSAAENPVPSAAPSNAFQGLDPGAQEIASQHFVTKAYGSDRARQASELAETLYNRIMTDTGLYAFQPPGLYSLVLYANRNEYLKKTQQPDWSAGITANNAIYVYDSPRLGPALADQISHLIFYQYMASPRQDYRWLDDGLAIYEQIQEMVSEGLRSDWRTQWQNAFRTRAIPFDQMINLVPATERDPLDDLWFQQVGDVVRFMIDHGGRNGMSQFLGAIRDGRRLDDAVRLGFPGVWNKFSDLESAWKLSL